MIDRVSTAVLEAHSQWELENNRLGGDYVWTTSHLELLTRTAIAAMREPTPAMFSAAPPTHGKDAAGKRIELLHGGPGDTWRAMIDAALQG